MSLGIIDIVLTFLKMTNVEFKMDTNSWFIVVRIFKIECEFPYLQQKEKENTH